MCGKLAVGGLLTALAIVSSSTVSAQEHWAFHVCKSVAASVTVQAGPRKDDNDVFKTWMPADGNKSFLMPARVQSLNKIYVKATTPGHDQTYMAITYDGRVVKKMEFNGGNEDHEVEANGKDQDCQ